MKTTIYLAIFVLLAVSAAACEKSVVSGNVENHADDMHVKFYCDGTYVDYKNIISKYGNYQRTLDYCEGTLTGELYLGETMIEEKTAESDLCDFDMDFEGLTEVPEFSFIGACVAVVGCLGLFLAKRN
ncbi:MAG: hypothetical protein ACLFUO_04915 [Candidatus Woesearchaeota archaeon]